MQVSVQKLSPVLLELVVQVEADRVRQELDRAYSMVARTAKVKGFRPGKAPRSVLVHMYGPRIAADVAQRLVDETYAKAVSEQKLQAVSQPAIESRQLVENQPFSYKARVEILPEIAQVTYDGFKATRTKVEVTRALLDAELLKLRRHVATLEPVEGRGAKTGDTVIVDFDVEVAGKPVADANARDLQVELGQGNLLPGIESAIEGKKAGDKAEAVVDMPASHPHNALRGKKCTIKLTITDVKTRVLPELDDEFAKDMGEHASLAELEKAISDQLEAQLKEQSETKLAEQLVEALVAANTIDVPPSLVQRQAQLTEQELMMQARRNGQQPQGLPPELHASIVRDSEIKVKAGLLMAAIAKQEQIKIGDAEIEKGLEELAAQSGKNIAKLRAEYRDAKKREMLIGMILENKVLDIIESKANIQDG